MRLGYGGGHQAASIHGWAEAARRADANGLSEHWQPELGRMPDPPSVSLWTRYVLENPWPLGGVLLLIAVIAARSWLREGVGSRLRIAGAAAVIGSAVIGIGLLVTTSGERARGVTKQFVEAVTASKVTAAVALPSDDASFAFGSPTNPGYDIDYIITQVSQFADNYTITGNRITRLDGYTESSDRATVHLACVTEVEGGWAPTPSQWVLAVSRQDDGSWKIERLTCISIAGRPVDRNFR